MAKCRGVRTITPLKGGRIVRTHVAALSVRVRSPDDQCTNVYDRTKYQRANFLLAPVRL